jgi:hypothetical protein
VVLAVGAAAIPSAANADRIRPIRQPLQPTVASDVWTAAGDGHVVWTVRTDDDTTDDWPATTALWTLRDGVPVQAATIPDGRWVDGLELGTDVAGVPVAYVETWDPTNGVVARRLVRLDTGEARRIPVRRRGRWVGGMAIDHGRIYSTENTRGTASLWRARLTGLRPGRATRIRTQRGPEGWGRLAADRNRIAVGTARDVHEFGQDMQLRGFAFGTPRGRWGRAGYEYIGDGPHDTVTVAGFTRDRSAIVLLRAADGSDLTATAVPLSGRGRIRRAHLWNMTRFRTGAPAFEPATGRFFGDGPTTAERPDPRKPDADGPTAVGFTRPVFPPG